MGEDGCTEFQVKEGQKLWAGMRCANCGVVYKSHQGARKLHKRDNSQMVVLGFTDEIKPRASILLRPLSETMMASAGTGIFRLNQAPLLEGFLMKRRQRIGFEKCYFVLYHEHLMYYKSQKHKKPAGVIPINTIQQVRMTDEKPLGCRFQVEVQGHTFYLGAEDKATASKWISELGLACDTTKNAMKAAANNGSPGGEGGQQQIDMTGKFWKNVVDNVVTTSRIRSSVIKTQDLGNSNNSSSSNAEPLSPGQTAVGPPILQGTLKKKSPRTLLGVSQWQARYFILSSDALVYSKNAGERPVGAIPLSLIASVRNESKSPLRFAIVALENSVGMLQDRRVFYLEAPTAEECQRWVSTLRSQIQEAKKQVRSAQTASAQAKIEASSMGARGSTISTMSASPSIDELGRRGSASSMFVVGEGGEELSDDDNDDDLEGKGRGRGPSNSQNSQSNSLQSLSHSQSLQSNSLQAPSSSSSSASHPKSGADHQVVEGSGLGMGKEMGVVAEEDKPISVVVEPPLTTVSISLPSSLSSSHSTSTSHSASPAKVHGHGRGTSYDSKLRMSSLLSDIENNKSVRLDLRDKGLTSSELVRVMDALAKNWSVRYVDLSGNALDNTDLIVVGKCLVANSRLSHLNLAQNAFDDQGVVELMNSVGHSGVASLNLEYNDPLSMVGCAALIDAVKQGRLTELWVDLPGSPSTPNPTSNPTSNPAANSTADSTAPSTVSSTTASNAATSTAANSAASSIISTSVSSASVDSVSCTLQRQLYINALTRFLERRIWVLCMPPSLLTLIGEYVVEEDFEGFHHPV